MVFTWIFETKLKVIATYLVEIFKILISLLILNLNITNLIKIWNLVSVTHCYQNIHGVWFCQYTFTLLGGGGGLWLCLSSFPRVETHFNTHYQNVYICNRHSNAFLELLRLSSNSIASTSREEGLVTARLHCTVDP